ncbi:MAG: hypothetical protein PVG06_20370, partial [Desulfobacterales bacterium]
IEFALINKLNQWLSQRPPAWRVACLFGHRPKRQEHVSALIVVVGTVDSFTLVHSPAVAGFENTQSRRDA